MQNYNEIKWSVVVRDTIEKKLDDLEMMDRIAAKSKFTEGDADEIGRLIKADLAKEIWQE
jgi:hypothetical protein